MEPRYLLALGQDEIRYGQASFYEPEPGVACALSVGSDRNSPGLAAKGDRRWPNEDGLLVLAMEDHLLLAVTDSHHGLAAGHSLLDALLAEATSLPTDLGELGLLTLRLREAGFRGPGGTTLLVVGLNRRTGEGFGLSWGDSTALVVSPNRVTSLTSGNHNFLLGGGPLEPGRAERFSFLLGPEEMVLLYTDGVNECHYGRPESSITQADIGELVERTGAAPVLLVESLMEMALQGVRQHPGGQDNVAIVAVRLQERFGGLPEEP